MPPETPNRELSPDWTATSQAILGPMGGDLLHFMRQVFFGEVSSVDQTVSRVALQLGWITKDGNGQLKLTRHGGHVADSAREYCNWLDDGRGLPSAITEEDIQGKAVLDIGCGFGRYVFAASHSASLAVGLEAEQTYLEMSSVLGLKEGVSSAYFVRGTGEKLPFTGGSFDTIICIRSLWYMDAFIAVPEIARILKIGGRLFLVYNTFQRFFVEMKGTSQQSLRIRQKLGIAEKMINSLSLSWTGKKIFSRKSNGTTGTYNYLTMRRILSITESAGLRLVDRSVQSSAAEQLFIFERIR